MVKHYISEQITFTYKRSDGLKISLVIPDGDQTILHVVDQFKCFLHAVGYAPEHIDAIALTYKAT
jgi:hypothetical protein